MKTSVVQEAAMPNSLARLEQTQSAFLFSLTCARVDAKRADHAQLRWVGDGIGLDVSQAARINFLTEGNRVVALTLAETLARSDEIDARGLWRILAAARCAFEAGDLSESDARAWQQGGVEAPAIAASDSSRSVLRGQHEF
jgi:hypothetical protein